MKQYILLTAAVSLMSCAEQPTHRSSSQQGSFTKPQYSPQPTQAPTNWSSWANWIEKHRSTADEQGHGPDVGSDEWAGSVDHQLGISEGGHGPDLKSPEWRLAVERKLGLNL